MITVTVVLPLDQAKIACDVLLEEYQATMHMPEAEERFKALDNVTDIIMEALAKVDRHED